MVNDDRFNTGKDANSWAIILGGSGGLGLASAKKLAAHGLNICILHRTRRSKLGAFETAVDALRKDGARIKEFNRDAMQLPTIEEVIRFFKEDKAEVKLLLHSIAKGNLKPLYAENPSKQVLNGNDFQLTAESMAFSLIDWSQALVQAGLFEQNSRILAFTSEGSRKPLPGYAAVSAAKASLEAITRSLAFEFASLGITANCIQAGVTDTESLRLIPGSEQIKEQALARNPNKRLTRPEDVADVVYLLCRAEASWINGTVIPVDGGEHLQ